MGRNSRICKSILAFNVQRVRDLVRNISKCQTSHISVMCIASLWGEIISEVAFLFFVKLCFRDNPIKCFINISWNECKYVLNFYKIENSTSEKFPQFFSLFFFYIKVEKSLKGSLDSMPSPSPSVKIQIMGGKVCLRCKGKTLLGVVNKLLKTKSFLTSPSNVFTCYLK